MGFLKNLFGSKSEAAPRPEAQSKPPVQSKPDDQSVFCDSCNQPASFATGTYFTASEFLTLLQKGLEPHRQVFTLLRQVGVSTEAFTAALPGEISLTYTTGWLLCPSCAPEANRILPKRAGNLPAGEPDAKGRERTFRDASGKMFFMARAMATKALSGGATAAKQADYTSSAFSLLRRPPEIARN